MRDPPEMKETTLDSDYDRVIYTDRSAQMPRQGFRVEDQRAETGFAVVVMSSSPEIGEMKVVEIRKGTTGGRATNFDTETAVIKAVIRWVKQNRIKDTIIRSDSMAAIQRAKNTRAGLEQGMALKIRKLMSKVQGNVYIEWVKGDDRSRGNEITDKMAKEARSKTQRTTTISYLTMMISRRATRDNYPGVPSRHYLFE